MLSSSSMLNTCHVTNLASRCLPIKGFKYDDFDVDEIQYDKIR